MLAEEFQLMMKEECAIRKVKLHVSSGKYVVSGPGTRSNGYFFDGDQPILAYCTGTPFNVWFPTAVHEFNHMLQWWEDSPYWVGEGDEHLWDWLAGEKNLRPRRAKRYVMSALRCELDCERRSLKMAQVLDLPGDFWTNYAKIANAYIYFYHLVLKHRKWYQIGKEPYNIPALVEAMPNHFNNNYETIPERLVVLYEHHMPYLLE